MDRVSRIKHFLTVFQSRLFCRTTTPIKLTLKVLHFSDETTVSALHQATLHPVYIYRTELRGCPSTAINNIAIIYQINCRLTEKHFRCAISCLSTLPSLTSAAAPPRNYTVLTSSILSAPPSLPPPLINLVQLNYANLLPCYLVLSNTQVKHAIGNCLPRLFLSETKCPKMQPNTFEVIDGAIYLLILIC